MKIMTQLLLIANSILIVYTHTSHSLEAELFTELDGYRLDLHSVGTMAAISRAECVGLCMQLDGCEAVNLRSVGSRLECDMQHAATANTGFLTQDPDSSFIYVATLAEDCSDIYPAEGSPCINDLFQSQDEPYGWRYHCTTGRKDLDHYMPLHRPLVCRWACEEYDTCVYYQLHNHHCYLCIRNDDEYSQAELTEELAGIAAEAFVKRGIEDVIFTSTACRGAVYPDDRPEGNTGFDDHSQRVIGIQFCQTSFDQFIDYVAGFTLYFTSNPWSLGSNPMHGCVYLIQPDPFDYIQFATDEIVLNIDLYMGWSATNSYYVLTAITMHTTHAQYGPLGVTSGSTLYEVKGYNFLGFTGWAGYAVDYIGANFHRC